MSEVGAIEESEARRIVRLIGEVALSEGSRNDRRQALMNGLAAMIGADCWLWFNAAHSNVEDEMAMTFILRGGLSDEQLGIIMSMPKEPESAELMAQFYEDLNASGGLTTRLQQQLFSEELFKSTKIYGMWKQAGIGPAILSARPNAQGQVSMVGFYRFDGREAFSERDSRIAHITLSEIASLHEDVTSSDLWSDVVALSPRLREILNCLIQGFDRKKISRQLDLSLHTVGSYIADIYQRFGVHSQAELMHRFLVGDGGDSPLRSN